MASNEREYWMSLEEPDGASAPGVEQPDPENTAWSRRSFLRAAGFGAATGLLAGCSQGPVRKAIPHLVPAEEVVPGRPYHYASTCGGCNAGCGVVVQNRDGRPIKLEGWRGAAGALDLTHPVSRGGLCAAGQASLLGLYDSKRLAGPTLDGKKTGWPALDREMTRRIARVRGAGRSVAVLTGTVTSPTTRARIAALLDGVPNGRHVEYDTQSCSALMDAHEACFGGRVLPRYRFDRADVIVGIDCDFLGTWVSPVEYAEAYAHGREPRPAAPTMSWHGQIEGRLSLTGSKADRRYVATPQESSALLRAVATGLAGRANRAIPWSAAAPEGRKDDVDDLVDRLWKARGRALVVCGTNDLSSQITCCLVNELLDAYGRTLDIRRPSHQRAGRDEDVTALIESMERGEVGMLVVHGVNPAYDRPDGARFARALEHVDTVVACATAGDETSRLADVVAPTPHFLEAWDDAVPVAGVLTLTQPTIEPLFDVRSFGESVGRWSGDGDDDLAFRKQVLSNVVGADAAIWWNQALHDGVRLFDAAATPTPRLAEKALAGATAPVPDGGDYRLCLYQGVAMLDGRHGHNAWLHEIADPITKTTWGNVASVAPGAARRLGVVDGDEVALKAGDDEIRLPVRVQPGQHDRVIAVALGYGRLGTDRFARIGPEWIEAKPTTEDGGRVGANAAPLLTLASGRVADGAAVTVRKTGRHAPLAATQSYDSIDVPAHLAPPGGRRRPIVRETTTGALASGAALDHGHYPDADLWPDDHANDRPHWGMVIDLNKCTGCSACVVACQVENNVPVVGRDEVVRHREMHWIRIDRYYSGDPEDAEGVDVIHQPMTCHHCDNAPCESVCPVLATVHSEEGLNQQVYNRCVGTRYCANNCPYKVRRFNWFDYAHEDRLQNMVLNPDIAVRMRGVMEKCSFCVQRIQAAKAEAKRTGRPLADGDVQPACMQTCPTQAIVFGDTKQKDSRVTLARQDSLHFTVLEELNVKPSVGYRTLIRNRDEVEGDRHG